MKKEILITAVLMAMGGMMNDISAHDVYQLNPVTVTAQRIETTALSTPATETVINSRKIRTAGYKNAFDVIEHQVGISVRVMVMPDRISASPPVVQSFAVMIAVLSSWSMEFL